MVSWTWLLQRSLFYNIHLAVRNHGSASEVIIASQIEDIIITVAVMKQLKDLLRTSMQCFMRFSEEEHLEYR